MRVGRERSGRARRFDFFFLSPDENGRLTDCAGRGSRTIMHANLLITGLGGERTRFDGRAGRKRETTLREVSPLSFPFPITLPKPPHASRTRKARTMSQQTQQHSHLSICPADLPDNVFTLQRTGQLAALFTIIRDTNTHRGDFVFYADRICRLLIEEGESLSSPVSVRFSLARSPPDPTLSPTGLHRSQPPPRCRQM